MLENRSFDHMCGWLGLGDGLTADTSNPLDPANPASPRVKATRDAAWTTIDPGHSVLDVNEQLFGSVTVPDPAVPTNNGFVLSYSHRSSIPPGTAGRIMDAFDPSHLPVLSALAREFVVCDRWFASVPGQTWPNRFFAHAATSGGFADNQLRDYTFTTLYHRLHDRGHDWAVYFHDFPHAYSIPSLRRPDFLPHFRFAPQFFLDVKHDRLPAYSFIEPRYFDFLRWRANDQHPPHDVRLGEHLVADIYEALRKSRAWDSTMFVVLYDEHGGFFDHVGPPPAVNPDGKVSTNPPFAFDRLGVRVPAIVISPRVASGVDSAVFDHTSLIATARRMFGLGDQLTARDGAANDLTHLVQTEVRRDTPVVLGRPAEPTADAFRADSAKAAMTAEHVVNDMATGQASSAPLTEFQRSLVDTVHALQTTERPRSGVLVLARLIDNEHEGAVQVRDTAARLFDGGR
jgi:phospholipase C